MIVELGEWISEKILGADNRKSSLSSLQLPFGLNRHPTKLPWLVEVPLTMAFQKDQAHSGVSLADRRVIFLGGISSASVPPDGRRSTTTDRANHCECSRHSLRLPTNKGSA